jgi:hypothetical protein
MRIVTILYYFIFISYLKNTDPSIFQHLLEQFLSLLSLNSHLEKVMPLRLNPANILPFRTFSRLIDFNCKQIWSSQKLLMTPRVHYRLQSYAHYNVYCLHLRSLLRLMDMYYFSLLCLTKTVLLLNNDCQNVHDSLACGCEYDNRRSYYLDTIPLKSNCFLQ